MKATQPPVPDNMIWFGFQFAPVGLAVTRERIIARCNPAFCEIFGYSEGDLRGQPFSILYPSNDEFIEIGRLGRVGMMETGTYQDERVMKRADGSLFWCRARGQSQDPKKPFSKCVWSIVDLSDSRPLVELTRRERQVAMFLLQAKTTRQIAELLGLSPRTVEVYRAKLLKKFGAQNASDLLSKLSGMPI